VSKKVTKRIPANKRRLIRRKKRISFKVKGTVERPRMAVFRSNKAMYVQIIDDTARTTLVAASTNTVKPAFKNTKAGAASLGKHVAGLALKANITAVVFDRAGFLYHGKVKALADGAREGGLKF
jgi:large subunit ribosomal protein L18